MYSGYVDRFGVSNWLKNWQVAAQATLDAGTSRETLQGQAANAEILLQAFAYRVRAHV